MPATLTLRLTLHDNQLYHNGRLVTRGGDSDPQVELPDDAGWYPVSTAHQGIVARFADEDHAALFAQLLLLVGG